MGLPDWLVFALTALLTAAAMEAFAWWAHKYIMHGWGWNWHRSHHEPHDDLLEKNDLYALVFAGFAILLFAVGDFGYPLVKAVALGISLYGLLYFIVHDGLVHQRWPFRYVPHRGYAKRLVQAHRLHHAVRGRDHGVSFGFLYAPPLARLQAALKASGVIAGEKSAATKRERAQAPTDAAGRDAGGRA